MLELPGIEKAPYELKLAYLLESQEKLNEAKTVLLELLKRAQTEPVQSSTPLLTHERRNKARLIANLRLARLEARQGRRAAADEALERAVAIARQLRTNARLMEIISEELISISELYCKRGDWSTAERVLQEGVDLLDLLSPTTQAPRDLHITAAYDAVLIARGKVAEAMVFEKRCRAFWSRTYDEVALKLLEWNLPKMALSTQKRCEARHRASGDGLEHRALFSQGEIYIRLGKFQQAMHCLAKARTDRGPEFTPEDWGRWYLIKIRALHRLKDKTGAMKVCTEVRELYRHHRVALSVMIEALTVKTSVLRDTGCMEGALEVCDERRSLCSRNHFCSPLLAAMGDRIEILDRLKREQDVLRACAHYKQVAMQCGATKLATRFDARLRGKSSAMQTR